MQQRAHRLVLGRVGLRLTRLRHQRSGLGQRIRQTQSAAGSAGGARGGRQQCRARQGPRRAIPIERSTEQQQGVGGRAVTALERERIGARVGGLRNVEGAGQRQRCHNIGAAERVAFDVGLDLGVDRLDRVAEREQITQTFALLQTKLRAMPFRVGEWTLEC